MVPRKHVQDERPGGQPSTVVAYTRRTPKVVAIIAMMIPIIQPGRWLCTYSPIQQYRGITTNACIGVLQGPRNSVSAVCTTERGVCRNSVARSVSRVCRPRSRLRVIREEVSCVLVRRPSG